MLQDKAMLVDVTLSAYTPHKKSRKMAHAAAMGLSVNEEYVIASKRLASRDHFKPIVNQDGKIRQFIYLHTRPWFDNSWRILPTASYFDFIDGINPLLDKRAQLVEELAQEWPAIIEESKLALNGEFNQEDFPEDIRSKYTHDVLFMPIPRMGDFRADGIDPEDVAKIEAATMARIEEQFSSRDLWQRIQQELTTETGTVADRLRNYGTDPTTGKVVNKFHDTLITNIKELVSILPKLNIAQDPEVNKVALRLWTDVCAHDPQELRDNPVLREDVAAQADKILADISAFMA